MPTATIAVAHAISNPAAVFTQLASFGRFRWAMKNLVRDANAPDRDSNP
jgi:hypothetical protein